MIIATAHPNKRYRWYHSISDFIIHAQLQNSQVRYYEIADDRNKCLSEKLVRDLFPDGILIKDRPFLVKENREFYAILHRHRKEYQNTFTQLIQSKQIRTKFQRTK